MTSRARARAGDVEGSDDGGILPLHRPTLCDISIDIGGVAGGSLWLCSFFSPRTRNSRNHETPREIRYDDDDWFDGLIDGLRSIRETRN